MKNELVLRDLGRAYANAAAEFLGEKYGSQVDLGELAAFHASAASWMVAKTFALLFQKADPAEAERFLHQVLSGISAAIRIHKIPVMVSIEEAVEMTEDPTPEPEAPVHASAPTQTAAPAAPPEAPEPGPLGCACKLKNGGCGDCASKTTEKYRDLADYLLTYMKTMAEKTQELTKGCPVCAARYSDVAIAAVAHARLSKNEPRELTEQVLAALIQVAGAVLGVTEIPLTEKILKG